MTNIFTLQFVPLLSLSLSLSFFLHPASRFLPPKENVARGIC
jgi:hypothetical protein